MTVKSIRTLALLALLSAVYTVPSHEAENIYMQNLPMRFYHENFHSEKLKSLKKYAYSEYCKTGKDEYERMLLLKDWVHRELRYSLKCMDQQVKNSLMILNASREGSGFICTHFTSLYIQSALSVGWTARYFFFKSTGIRQHAAPDIWSNQYRKWIFIDPSWNIHIEKNGVPLTINEIRNEWIKNRGRDIIFVFGAGKGRRDYTYNDLPIKSGTGELWARIPIDREWLNYFFAYACLGRNDFFSYPGGDKSGRNIWSPIYIVKDKVNNRDMQWAFRNRHVITPDEMFFDLNTVNAALENNDGHSAIVHLRHQTHSSFTPGFKRFIVSLNGKQWETTEDIYRTDLERGVNTLRFRIENIMGVVGPITELKVFGKGD